MCMNILIKNATNTSDLLPPFPYITWLEYWESKKQKLDTKTLYQCPTGCGNTGYRKDFDGCHVQKVHDITRRMYIVPLCSGCNHKTDSFYVDENLLIPAP